LKEIEREDLTRSQKKQEKADAARKKADTQIKEHTGAQALASAKSKSTAEFF
jgi:hypothetical protein